MKRQVRRKGGPMERGEECTLDGDRDEEEKEVKGKGIEQT